MNKTGNSAPNLRRLMKESVRFCSPHDNLNQAANLLWGHDCGVLPVVEDGRVVAMLTDRDICMAAYLQNRTLTDLQVSTAMSRELYSCSPDDTPEDAEHVMREHQVRRVPVTDAEGKLLGILSLSDLAREAVQAQIPERTLNLLETLNAIAAPRPRVEDPEQFDSQE